MEGYVKSYIYSPDQYTFPVEKANNLVEMFRRAPESGSAPGTTEAAEARDDAQMDQIKEAKQKNVAVDTNRSKRKAKDEARSARAKSSRMATPSNGEAEEGQGRVMMKLILECSVVAFTAPFQKSKSDQLTNSSDYKELTFISNR